MSTTILNRPMHRCRSLEFDGRSYRLQEAAGTHARKSEASYITIMYCFTGRICATTSGGFSSDRPGPD
jgi:hypothetical protein